MTPPPGAWPTSPRPGPVRPTQTSAIVLYRQRPSARSTRDDPDAPDRHVPRLAAVRGDLGGAVHGVRRRRECSARDPDPRCPGPGGHRGDVPAGIRPGGCGDTDIDSLLD